jgi:prephenate dehydrogenase
VPVAATEATLKSIKHILTPNTLVMDVGSTKRNVVDAARRVLKDQVGIFIAAHPIAGKELSGVEHADASLYTNKQVILTPIERTQTVQLNKATKLWEALNCQVLKMSPEAHDSAYAAVSHLPHLIAFAFVNAITDQPNGREYLSLAGMGFRDFTRIAASDSKLWTDVIMANRQELLAQTRLFQKALGGLERLMQEEQTDQLEHEIDRASLTRAQWKMTQRK